MPIFVSRKKAYLSVALASMLFWAHSTFSQTADTFDASTPIQPTQLQSGPGGSAYPHNTVLIFDQADDPDGYWLFVPAAPVPDTAPVVTFLHGYGGYNPLIYGGWIRHLVRKGNIVIFPRYQRNLWRPAPKRFPNNAAQGILDALEFLKVHELCYPDVRHYSYIGHSYGGVIAANLSVRAAVYGLPQPKAVMLCSPGTGPFNGALLDSYEQFPAETRLLIITGENDRVVGETFAWKLFNEAVHTTWRNLLRQYKDPYGTPPVGAGHNQCYAPDLAFDSKIRNRTTRRALRIGRIDAVDYFGYWKLGDALLACVRAGQWCEIAFGGSEAQRSLGHWSDGTPIRPLEAFLPPDSLEVVQASR